MLFIPIAPPAIVVRPPATNDVDVNSIVELVCVAYGNPVPTISWGRSDISNIHNDSLINALVYSDIVSYGDVMFRKSVLQFCTISSRDSNAYICSATNGINGAGIASSTATFNVAVILQPSKFFFCRCAHISGDQACKKWNWTLMFMTLHE